MRVVTQSRLTHRINRLRPARILPIALGVAFCLGLAQHAEALITVGVLDTPRDARDVEIVGGLAYVADGPSGLRVIDVSDPAAPFEVGALDTLLRAMDVEVVDGVAYVADYWRLVVVDVSDPAAPVEIGEVFIGGETWWDVEVVGGLAYVAGGDSGLRIIDFGPEYNTECGDGLDNDGDGLADMADPGCLAPTDPSEREAAFVCDDGEDNDGDTLVDYPNDPGCFHPAANTEEPVCQDGDDNDGDGKIDFDGGLSALGYAAAEPDPQCTDPWQAEQVSCGLGAELALLLAPLIWLWRRRGI